MFDSNFCKTFSLMREQTLKQKKKIKIKLKKKLLNELLTTETIEVETSFKIFT